MRLGLTLLEEEETVVNNIEATINSLEAIIYSPKPLCHKASKKFGICFPFCTFFHTGYRTGLQYKWQCRICGLHTATPLSLRSILPIAWSAGIGACRRRENKEANDEKYGADPALRHGAAGGTDTGTTETRREAVPMLPAASVAEYERV